MSTFSYVNSKGPSPITDEEVAAAEASLSFDIESSKGDTMIMNFSADRWVGYVIA